jgi:DNA-directed RNA polymerase subunit K/omega
MTDEKETPAEEQKPASEGGEVEEEITEPRSKYELIMMAAAEAGRLNEESRRKGTKLNQKVTLEALRRVRDGKVKAVITVKTPVPIGKPMMPATDSPDALFGNPPLLPLDRPGLPELPELPEDHE